MALRPLLPAAGSLVVTIGALLGSFATSAPTGSARQALVIALKGQRVFEARLTGGFHYAPYRHANVDRGRAARSLPPDLAIALASVERSAQHQATADDTALVGATYLVAGKTESAVSAFVRAAARAPANARILSDLAAAYLTRADGVDAVDLVRALDAAARATRIAPALAEAQYNLALALEQLGVADLAADTWQHAATLERSAGWASAASGRAARLREHVRQAWEGQQAALAAMPTSQVAASPLIEQNPQLVREYIEDVALPRWASDVLAGRTGAADEMHAHLRRIAQRLETTQGDAQVRHAVASLQHDGCRQSLAQAHLTYATARARYAATHYVDAEAQFNAAATAFRACHSSYETWTAFYLGVIAYFKGDRAAASEALASVEREAGQHGYANVLGRVLWMRAILETGASRMIDALRSYQAAERMFSQTREAEGLAAAANGQVEPLADLGLVHDSWTRQARALAAARLVRPVRRHAIYFSAATNAAELGLLEAAGVFAEQMRRNALQGAPAAWVVESYTREAMIHGRLGLPERAAADLTEAARWLDRIDDASTRTRQLAELSAVQASLWADAAPTKALEASTRALTFFEQQAWSRRLPALQLARGRALAHLGSLDDATAALTRGIEYFERARRHISPGQLRASFLDEAWDLFEALIHLQATDPTQSLNALATAEQARARVLAEAIHTEPGRDHQAAAPPPGVSVVYYVELDDRLLIWLLREGDVRLIDRPISRTQLEERVTALRTALEDERPDAEVRTLSATLYDDLVRPVAALLRPTGVVAFVPHGTLHRIPFAALYDRDRGQYLIEQHVVGVAPSLRILRDLSVRIGQWQSTAATRVVAFGDPVSEPQEGAVLPVLREARAEARAVGALYRQAIVLTGAEATKAAFLAQVPRAEVVHFAGHAIANPRVPDRSRLLLTPGAAGETGAVYPSEITRLPLHRTRLAVLGACRTGDGPSSRSEGVLSLARPFLAAGVPAVVATLWDVDDRASRQLLTALHTTVRDGADAWRALRTSQLALLRGPDAANRHASRWAGFVAIGGASAASGQTSLERTPRR